MALGLVVAVVLSLALPALVGGGAAGGVPENREWAEEHPPYHGVNSTLFPVLWSGDADGNVSTATNAEATAERTAIDQLASGTDLPLGSPPQAIEGWNRGDHSEFPRTSWRASVRPAGIETENGRFLQDAYVAIFAVQPSTRARLSRSNQPLYVGEAGTVLGALDYRVAVPDDDTEGNRRVRWTLLNHEIEDLRLLVDGTLEDSRSPSHTPVFQFETSRPGDGQFPLQIRATVSVRLRKHIKTIDRRCRPIDNETVCTEVVTHEYEYPTESLTLSARRGVRTAALNLSGSRARYPNGDLGLALSADGPWLGHSVPDGEILGSWRFYSARDPDWDELIRSVATGSRRVDSPSHPLQVFAYPAETGPSASHRTVAQPIARGPLLDPPSLPEQIDLDEANGPYEASHSLVSRTTGVSNVSGIRAWGLVRGETVEIGADEMREVPVNRSSLTLSVTEDSGANSTLQIHLVDAATGEPIGTADRAGSIVLDGRRLNTSQNGTVNVTIEGTDRVLTARYEPGPWYRQNRAYVGATDTLRVETPVLRVLLTLFRLVVPVGLLLLAVYLVDRITRWQIWPPWEGL